MEEHARVLKQMKENAGEKSESEDENEEEWDGIEEPPAVDYEAEYIDEDKYTTVTVEEMDPSREGLLKAVLGEDEETEEKKEYPAPDEEADKKPKRKAGERIARKKKRNFRYESKDVRRATARKQRSVKSNKAKARRGAEAEK
jgi:ribosomal RNA-processing protein 17